MPTARTRDIDTYYERRGNGPPVVFVHGMFMSATMWEPQLAALSDAYAAVAYDVRGHGRTGRSDWDRYSMELFAADLEALLDALGLDRVAVCGLSMGGAVAQTFAAAHPDRVAGLVLADTFPAGPMPLMGKIAMANIRFLARLDRLIGYKTLNRLQLRVGNWLLPGVAGDEETLQALVEADPTIPHAELVKIADATARFPRLDLDLAAVTAPALVLHGEHVPSAYPGITDRVAAQLANAEPEVSVVPGAGHASNLDNPDFFNDAVRRLLDRADWSDSGGRHEPPDAAGSVW